jgi:hypothetical protein
LGRPLASALSAPRPDTGASASNTLPIIVSSQHDKRRQPRGSPVVMPNYPTRPPPRAALSCQHRDNQHIGITRRQERPTSVGGRGRAVMLRRIPERRPRRRPRRRSRSPTCCGRRGLRSPGRVRRLFGAGRPRSCAEPGSGRTRRRPPQAACGRASRLMRRRGFGVRERVCPCSRRFRAGPGSA